MIHSRTSMGFTEKRVSVNAVFAVVLGMILNALHVVMIICSVKYKGDIPFWGGVTESYLFLFSIFGLLWAILSLDDEKTVGKYKYTGIVLNGIAFLLSLWIMVLGVRTY